MICRRTLRVSVAVAAASLLASPAGSAPHLPLEIVNIRPADAAGPSRGSRVYRAYPGVEYNIRAAVVGGVFPFTYALAGAPAGMSIDPRTGEISWPDPRATATPTIVVRDSAGAEVRASWTIEVSAHGFRFIDAANGGHAQGNGCTASCGTGTLANPWRSLSDMYGGSTAGEFVYFRKGTYRVADLPKNERSVGGPWERVEISEAKKPVVWLAYPGERPILDFGYKRGGTEAASLLRLVGDNVYVDGFETANSHLIAFQAGSVRGRGPTFRRLRMHTHGPGLDGSNASFIMTLTSPTPASYMVVQDCEFFDAPSTVMMKLYAQQKMLVEDNVFHHALAGVELKDDLRQFTLRGNTFHDITGIAIGGNMHETTTSGEILFNNVRSAAVALDVNQDGMAGPIEIYRNTFVGRVEVRNTDGADGPFVFADNVIVSSDSGASRSRISQRNVTAPGRIVAANNLTGRPSDNLVDASGNLTAAHARYLGVRGHQRR